MKCLNGNTIIESDFNIFSKSSVDGRLIIVVDTENNIHFYCRTENSNHYYYVLIIIVIRIWRYTLQTLDVRQQRRRTVSRRCVQRRADVRVWIAAGAVRASRVAPSAGRPIDSISAPLALPNVARPTLRRTGVCVRVNVCTPLGRRRIACSSMAAVFDRRRGRVESSRATTAFLSRLHPSLSLSLVVARRSFTTRVTTDRNVVALLFEKTNNQNSRTFYYFSVEKCVFDFSPKRTLAVARHLH